MPDIGASVTAAEIAEEPELPALEQRQLAEEFRTTLAETRWLLAEIHAKLSKFSDGVARR